jgi:hypothetical protein
MGLLRPVNQSDHVRAFDLMSFKPRFRLHKRIIPLGEKLPQGFLSAAAQGI